MLKSLFGVSFRATKGSTHSPDFLLDDRKLPHKIHLNLVHGHTGQGSFFVGQTDRFLNFHTLPYPVAGHESTGAPYSGRTVHEGGSRIFYKPQELLNLLHSREAPVHHRHVEILQARLPGEELAFRGLLAKIHECSNTHLG